MILYAGISVFIEKNDERNFSDVVLEKTRKYLRVFDGKHDGRFFVQEDGKTKITILVVAIFCLEACDIIFAFDSIPALFSITNSKIVMYTSNAFAIIGLRSLYIVFAIFVRKLYYLKYGVAMILCLIGLKMILADYMRFDSSVYMSIIVGILVVSSGMSVLRNYLAKNCSGKE
ncbi:hypothetical protein FACS189472_03700 [Alphaproteobacteria bacterium]|nr:hypothetical protein FACS189472_03700 [Alphaproteobacteria bacterium]